MVNGTPKPSLLARFRAPFRDGQFRALLSLVAVVLLTGMVFYSRVEHWRLLDSLYFSVITLTTVGYGDFSPHTDAGKIFTMIYLVTGVGIILGFVNVIARHATQRYVRQSAKYFEQSEKAMEKLLDSRIRKNS